MSFYKKTTALIIALSTFGFAADANIDINITIPAIDNESTLEGYQVEIGSFFTPNHQFYPLTPDQHKRNHNQDTIFSAKEAFAILYNNGSLFKDVPRGRLLSLHLTINKQAEDSPISVSVSSSSSKSFKLIPIDKEKSPIRVKIYLVDLNSSELTNPIIEVFPGERYSVEQVSGRTLFMLIPNKGWASFQTINFNDYSIPLEVTYHSP